MDKWGEMQVFVACVKQGSFSAAGRSLELSPSAVSKLISRLENRLGVRLLNRTTRSLSLTEAGHAFYQRCLEILTELDEAEAELTDYGQSPKGVLKVNCSPGFATHQLLPVLPQFQQQYPDLTVELQLTGQAVDLVTEGVDVSIRLGQLQDTSLVARKLGECSRIICASAGYIQQYGKPNTPQDLYQFNCLRLSTREIFNQWLFSVEGQDQLIRVKGNFVTDNVEALLQQVLAGQGIARLSGFMVSREIAAGRLVPLLQDYKTERQQVHAVYPHRKFLAVKVRVFVDFLLQTFETADWH
ncbi:MAG: LysR family transcriptional regulator [Motiliproteus sp.]